MKSAGKRFPVSFDLLNQDPLLDRRRRDDLHLCAIPRRVSHACMMADRPEPIVYIGAIGLIRPWQGRRGGRASLLRYVILSAAPHRGPRSPYVLVFLLLGESRSAGDPSPKPARFRGAARRPGWLILAGTAGSASRRPASRRFGSRPAPGRASPPGRGGMACRRRRSPGGRTAETRRPGRP